MNNNFKQAFSEVFGKGKDEKSNQDSLSENDTDENSKFINQSPNLYDFDGFEELKPTGETMSDQDKALIDKKAEEFAKTLGIKIGAKTKQNQDMISQQKNNNAEHKQQEQVVLTIDEIVKGGVSEPPQSQKVMSENSTSTQTENNQAVTYKYYDFKSQSDTIDKKQVSQTVKAEEVTVNKINKPVATVINNNSNVSQYTPTYTLKPISTTFIDATTKIDGSISSQSNLNISGEVKGDIVCGNDILISGKVIGSVSCEDFIADKAYIEGNITSKKNLILKNNSTVIGDISADVVEVSGKITGNIISVSELSILANSAVYGDINAKSIFVEKGSVIQGKVNIKYE